MDEMHIKADLVYDKHTGSSHLIYFKYGKHMHATQIIPLCLLRAIGALVGFTNIGDVNSHLTEYEQSMKEQEQIEDKLANSMLVLMVRGLFNKLQFAYAQFPCTELSGEQSYVCYVGSLSLHYHTHNNYS